MKNIFRLVAVALVASSMLFVACSKDEDDEETLATVEWTFGGKTYEATMTDGSFDYEYVDIYTSASKNIDMTNEKTLLPVMAMTIPADKGKFDFDDDIEINLEYTHNQFFQEFEWVSNFGNHYDWYTDDPLPLEEGETISIEDTVHIGKPIFQYYASAFDGKVSTYDATAGTISLTANATMKKWEEAYMRESDGTFSVNEVPTTNMTITVRDLSLYQKQPGKGVKETRKRGR